MKKTILGVSLLVAAVSFSSCGSTGSSIFDSSSSASSTSTSTSSSSSSNSNQGLASLIGSAVDALLGNSSLKKADLIGAWKYNAPDCRFESEDLLKKAGGELVAQEVETKLSEAFSKVGITKGTCQMTFAEDGTCQIVMGTRTISGTYSFNEETQKLTLSAAFGLANLTANVLKSGSNLSILFDSDKLLTLVSLAGNLTNNATVKSISSILGSYDGMKVGFQMNK